MKRALRYACDNSLSPMETDIAETMVFDPRMGGFGLEKPQLNPRFEVTRKNRRALPQSAYLPDLFWPRANISVEYDSDKAPSRRPKGLRGRHPAQRHRAPGHADRDPHLGDKLETTTNSNASRCWWPAPWARSSDRAGTHGQTVASSSTACWCSDRRSERCERRPPLPPLPSTPCAAHGNRNGDKSLSCARSRHRKGPKNTMFPTYAALAGRRKEKVCLG